MKQIQVAIAGYGNLGRGVEYAVKQNPDLNLAAVITRRDPKSVQTLDPTVRVLPMEDALMMKAMVDVMILCGGSATDLPEQGPYFAEHFNTIDSFDTHAKIPEYFDAVHRAAQKSGHTAVISVGWDPGLFSLHRMLSQAVLPQGTEHTFWGRGVSQGHSDALRRIPGVKGAIQYTQPIEGALSRVRSGENPNLSIREKHLRECYVAAEPEADKAKIEHAIKTMPNYFSDYDTVVTFISEEELKKEHSSMPHGGFVIRSGQTGPGSHHLMEFALKLDSNPEFTASVLAAYARAAYRLHQEGQFGAKTVFDIPFGYLSPKSAEELRKELL